jgi:tetratricopeptide (TPR) repeat protein
MRTTANTVLVFCATAVLALAVFAQSPSFEQAMQLFQQRRWAEAAAVFAECEKSNPGETKASLYRGKSLVNLGQFEEAAAALENYRKTHPHDDDAAYLLGYVRFRQNKAKESLQVFTEAARLKSPTADDLKVVGLDYVLLDDYDDAARYLEESLALDPGNIEARYHLGRVRYQQNRFDLAIAAFREVLRRDPSNVRARDNLGLSLEAKNEIEPALEAYREAVKSDKSQAVHNEQPYMNLGALLAKSGHAEEAVLWLLRGLAIAPNSGKGHYLLAKAYFDLNHLEDSRREAEKAASLDPDDSGDHYLLGRIYQRSGKNELAKEQFSLTEQLIHAKSANSKGMASGMGPH